MHCSSDLYGFISYEMTNVVLLISNRFTVNNYTRQIKSSFLIELCSPRYANYVKLIRIEHEYLKGTVQSLIVECHTPLMRAKL